MAKNDLYRVPPFLVLKNHGLYLFTSRDQLSVKIHTDYLENIFLRNFIRDYLDQSSVKLHTGLS